MDGFRTLESGHYWPFDLNLVIGADSHYVDGFQHAELGRGGTLRPGQRRRRARLERGYGGVGIASPNVRETPWRIRS